MTIAPTGAATSLRAGILAAVLAVSTAAVRADPASPSATRLHDLPGVKGGYSIVTPRPEPDDAVPADASEPGTYKIGNLEVHIHGSISYTVGFSNGRYVLPHR
jgi:hypothetical protein